MQVKVSTCKFVATVTYLMLEYVFMSYDYI